MLLGWMSSHCRTVLGDAPLHITLCDEPESEEFAEANMVVDICIIPQVLSSSPMLILMDP